MYNGKITIESVDYERSLQELFPILLEKGESEELPVLIRKILGKMNRDLLPVLLKFIGYMSESEKEELLLWLLNNFKEQLISWLIQLLKNQKLNEAIMFEDINIVKTKATDGFILVVSGIRLDYDVLMKNGWRILREPLKGMEKHFPQFGISIFNFRCINAKVVKELTDFSQEKGLYLKIRDIVLVQDQKNVSQHGLEISDIEVSEKQTGLKLPETIEDILLDAVVNYLQDIEPAGLNQ